MSLAKNYEMSIELSVLNDLGINLYSNIQSVISEAVANAWDADAKKVEISINIKDKKIIIEDDGHGMNEREINDKYLKVGYKRRECGEEKSPDGRQVMGRKGIGKLSLFSIADTIQVKSVKTDRFGRVKEKDGFIMKTKKIKDAIKKQKKYKPDAIKENQISLKKGTEITLSDLKVQSLTDKYLRTRIARRFSVIGSKDKFKVYVNKTEVTVSDRDFYKKINYLWSIGNVGNKYKNLCKKVTADRHTLISGDINTQKKYTISGWVGTVNQHKDLEEENNSIVILARGKLIHEDMLKDIKEGGLFTKYIIGEIHADFVDKDKEEDMATSDRQNLKEIDSRFTELKNFVQKNVLKDIQKKWQSWRTEDGASKALKNPAIEEWYNRLKGDKKKYAKKLFGTIGAMPAEREDDKKELYKHGILAFEKLLLKDELSKIEKIKTDQDFKLINELFNSIDDIEANEYFEIINGRLKVIKKFEEIIDNDQKEKIIQQYIFDHLWLLHPSWSRESSNARIEKSVTEEFKKVTNKLTPDEKKARIDIRYKTAANKHIIIELKRYSAKVNVHDLCKQISKYRTALEKCLEKSGEKNPHIEVICILGERPLPKSDTEDKIIETLQIQKARYITYDALIAETIKSYEEYLDKNKKISELQRIIDKI